MKNLNLIKRLPTAILVAFILTLNIGLLSCEKAEDLDTPLPSSDETLIVSDGNQVNDDQIQMKPINTISPEDLYEEEDLTGNNYNYPN